MYPQSGYPPYGYIVHAGWVTHFGVARSWTALGNPVTPPCHTAGMDKVIYFCCGLIALFAMAAFPPLFLIVLIGLIGWAFFAMVA